ncbi:hypothetical protein TNCV_1191741 [Trichonephila clavipes]|nr:hypothetical protein TNCV_1191741 [Trichonephila clavipes]
MFKELYLFDPQFTRKADVQSLHCASQGSLEPTWNGTKGQTVYRRATKSVCVVTTSLYTDSLRCPHRKKTNYMRSGYRCGRRNGPHLGSSGRICHIPISSQSRTGARNTIMEPKTMYCNKEYVIEVRLRHDNEISSTTVLRAVQAIDMVQAEDPQCPMVLSEEFIGVDDDNVYRAPIMEGKDILEFVQNTKNIIDADSDDEKEMNNAAPVPTSF